MSNALFPVLPGLTWDVVKSPLWNTRVQSSVGGKEIRTQFFSVPLYRWQLKYELLRADATVELQTLLGFFNARQGKFDSFLYRDPSDNAVTRMGFGIGDGAKTAFQLQRNFSGQYADVLGSYPVTSLSRTNSYLYSEQFDSAAWNKTNATVVANVSQAPDGNGTMDAIAEGTSTGIHSVRQTAAMQPGAAYAVSYYVKPNGRTKCSLVLDYGSAGFHQAWFDVPNRVATITVGGAASGGVAAVAFVGTFGGQDVYRVSLVGIAPAGAGYGGAEFRLLDASLNQSYTGTSLDMHAWGAQFETNAASLTAPTAYIPTTSAPVTVTPPYWPAGGAGFEPVIDLDAGAKAPVLSCFDWQGLQTLYPSPRTNLLPGSSTVGAANWSPSNAGTGSAPTVSSGFADPAGGSAATRVQCAQGAGTTTGDYSLIVGTSAAAGIVGGSYTASVWLRSNTGANQSVYLSLSGASATLVTLTPVWQRFTCVINATWPNTSSPALNIGARGGSTAGGTTLDILAYGGQLETGITPTRLIPTVSTAVTVTDYALSASGLVTFAVAPVIGAVLSWSGSYSWRVRFDMDSADFNNFLYQLWEAKTITLVSVR